MSKYVLYRLDPWVGNKGVVNLFDSVDEINDWLDERIKSDEYALTEEDRKDFTWEEV